MDETDEEHDDSEHEKDVDECSDRLTEPYYSEKP